MEEGHEENTHSILEYFPRLNVCCFIKHYRNISSSTEEKYAMEDATLV